jgi:hypothetical protein
VTSEPPTDEEIVQHNVDHVLANRTRLYDHKGEKLDAVAVIEVAISERMQTIKYYRDIHGRPPNPWSRDNVANLRREAGLMEEALRRLRALGVTTNSSLARQLRWERENPLPTAHELLAPAAKLYRAGKHWKRVGVLLNMEKGVSGVDSGQVRRRFIKIAPTARVGDEPMHLSLTAGWGLAGQNGVPLPGKGKLVTRDYTAEERAALRGVKRSLLGTATHDVFMNETLYWQNVPENVWNYTVDGYPVMKKWLSYREHALLGRPLTTDEAREVTHLARRIAALLLLQPTLDQNYAAVKAATIPL